MRRSSETGLPIVRERHYSKGGLAKKDDGPFLRERAVTYAARNPVMLSVSV